MKKLLLSFSLILSFQTLAQVKIEEEIYVPAQKPEVVRELILSGSVIVDHVTSEGFELYGRKGLSQYLDSKNVLHFDMKEMNKELLADYPTHEQMTERLKAAVAKRPNLIKMTSIGKSNKGRDLWVIKISDNVDVDEVEPEFKYISSMHGDEITGREMTVALIEEMAQKYGSDREITELINNTEIYIMPSMNPDGSFLKQRANAKGTDLNRNFPDITRDTKSNKVGRELETQLVMDFQASRQFALSANFHGGTIVANYPWDSTYDRHPLDAFVQELSLVYAERNPEMHSSSEFKNGITNGADWYVVRGGMQDWSYFFFNDLQITLEVSHTKWPQYSEIPGFYRSNRDSMIAFMKEVHTGAGFKLSQKNVSGTVVVKQLSPVAKSLGSFAFKGSEFYKVMPEGNYEFTITEKNKGPKVIQVEVDRGSIQSNGNYISL